MKKILILIGCALPAFPLVGQNLSRGDSLISQAPDIAVIRSYSKRYDPRKALLYAAVLPGLGQVYNKKYWKLPLVYGGFFILGKRIKTYNSLHKDYRKQLFYNFEHNLKGENDLNPFTEITTGQLQRAVDRARRERDFFVILMGGMYLLQMVDAHVDAHLKEFDLNPKLQVSIEPVMPQDLVLGRQTGMSIILRF